MREICIHHVKWQQQQSPGHTLNYNTPSVWPLELPVVWIAPWSFNGGASKRNGHNKIQNLGDATYVSYIRHHDEGCTNSVWLGDGLRQFNVHRHDSFDKGGLRAGLLIISYLLPCFLCDVPTWRWQEDIISRWYCAVQLYEVNIK